MDDLACMCCDDAGVGRESWHPAHDGPCRWKQDVHVPLGCACLWPQPRRVTRDPVGNTTENMHVLRTRGRKDQTMHSVHMYSGCVRHQMSKGREGKGSCCVHTSHHARYFCVRALSCQESWLMMRAAGALLDDSIPTSKKTVAQYILPSQGMYTVGITAQLQL